MVRLDGKALKGHCSTPEMGGHSWCLGPLVDAQVQTDPAVSLSLLAANPELHGKSALEILDAVTWLQFSDLCDNFK